MIRRILLVFGLLSWGVPTLISAIPFLSVMPVAALSSAAFTTGPLSIAQSPPGLPVKIFVPSKSVSFSLLMEKTTLRIQETIPVNYRIANVSKGSLYVPMGFERTACLELGPPHIWGRIKNSAGKYFAPGYGFSCASTPGETPTLTERMVKGTVLLKPGEHFSGTLQLDATMFGGLPPGSYRIEAVLRGWKVDEFTAAELDELAKMGSPFLSDEVTASARITLTP